MIPSAEKLSNVHFEHLIWHNELENYLLEIQIIDQRIGTLLKETNNEILTNELRKYREKFHEIQDEIRTGKVAIGNHEYRILEVAAMDGSIKLITDSQHDEIRKTVHRLRKTMMRQKDRFQYFLAKKI